MAQRGKRRKKNKRRSRPPGSDLWSLAKETLYKLAKVGRDYVRDLDAAGLAEVSRHVIDQLRERGFDQARAKSVWNDIVADARGNDGTSNVVQRVTAVDRPGDESVFCFNHKRWRVSHDGETVFLPDRIGLHYIHLLLQQPFEDISALRLVQLVHAPPDTTSDSYYLSPEGARVEPLLDGQAIKELKRHLDEIDLEIRDAKASGNVSRQSELQLKKDYALEAIKAFIPTSDKETVPRELRNARTSVGNAISRAIARFADEHPALHRHLKTSIKKGYKCSYRPESLIRWQT